MSFVQCCVTMEMQHMNCCATVLLRYHGNATGCIGHVTKENPICHIIFIVVITYKSETYNSACELRYLAVCFSTMHCRLTFSAREWCSITSEVITKFHGEMMTASRGCCMPACLLFSSLWWRMKRDRMKDVKCLRYTMICYCCKAEQTFMNLDTVEFY
jgi:hypothetical protein